MFIMSEIKYSRFVLLQNPTRCDILNKTDDFLQKTTQLNKRTTIIDSEKTKLALSGLLQ